MRPAPSIDDQAAVFEQGGPDSRPRAAVEHARIAERIGRKSAEAPKRRGDRERELSAGPEPRVGGNRISDGQRLCRIEAEILRDAKRQVRAALDLMTQDLKAGAATQLDSGFEGVD